MSSTGQPSKRKFEKYETFMKELRLQKSIPILEKIYEDLKANKENLFNGSIVPYQYSSDLIISSTGIQSTRLKGSFSLNINKVGTLILQTFGFKFKRA